MSEIMRPILEIAVIIPGMPGLPRAPLSGELSAPDSAD